MKEYIIKFNDTKIYYEFFERIIAGLGFPDWCGKNLDAIWDLMTSNIVIPAVIYIEGTKSISKELTELYNEIIELFNEAVEWYKDIDCFLEIKIID